MQPLVTGNELPEWAKSIVFIYGVFVQPGLLAYIAFNVRELKKKSATKEGVALAIKTHKEECVGQEIVKAVTPTHGRGNGHARFVTENLD